MQTVAGVERAKKAAVRLGIAPSTLWRWTQQGRLPQPIRLSARCSVWRIADLEAFLEKQAAEGAK